MSEDLSTTSATDPRKYYNSAAELELVGRPLDRLWPWFPHTRRCLWPVEQMSANPGLREGSQSGASIGSFQPTSTNALRIKQLSQFKAWSGAQNFLASGNELPQGGFNLAKVGRAQEVRQQASPQRVLSQPVGLSRLHLALWYWGKDRSSSCATTGARSYGSSRIGNSHNAAADKSATLSTPATGRHWHWVPKKSANCKVCPFRESGYAHSIGCAQIYAEGEPLCSPGSQDRAMQAPDGSIHG
jgi:hypothetical protein